MPSRFDVVVIPKVPQDLNQQELRKFLEQLTMTIYRINQLLIEKEEQGE